MKPFTLNHVVVQQLVFKYYLQNEWPFFISV